MCSYEKDFNDPGQYFKARIFILGHFDLHKAHVVNEVLKVHVSSIKIELILHTYFENKICTNNTSHPLMKRDDDFKRKIIRGVV